MESANSTAGRSAGVILVRSVAATAIDIREKQDPLEMLDVGDDKYAKSGIMISKVNRSCFGARGYGGR